jgi:cytosine/adenosine deaminase-related metal-dependent hydrolase
MNCLIRNGTLITMQNKRIIRDGAVVIEDQIITEVGKTEELQKKVSKKRL